MPVSSQKKLPLSDGTPRPSLEEVGLRVLQDALTRSKVYLEYGCGGSTLLAVERPGLSIISIDSDQDWIDRVQSYLSTQPQGEAEMHILRAPLGNVAAWGRPTDRAKTTVWHKYSTLPWIRCRERGLVPDLVFVDGRFRVACFCASYISAREGATILFDDFADRKQYKIVRSLLQPYAQHGRMAEFVVPAHRDFALAAWLIGEYSVQPG